MTAQVETAPQAAPEPTVLTKLLTVWLVALLAIVSYLSVGHLTVGYAHGGGSGMAIDRWIPFLPWTVWIYLPMYALVFHVAVFFVRTRHTLNRTIYSLLITWAISYSIFAIWPLSGPRVPPTNEDTWTMWMMGALQAVDPPNNTFPSLHVADLLCVSLGCYRDDRTGGAGLLALSLFPMMATVTTKQHYAADLVGGIVVAVFSHWVTFRATRLTA